MSGGNNLLEYLRLIYANIKNQCQCWTT